MGAKGRGGPICFGRPELTVSVRLAHASLTLIGSRQFGRPSSHASAPPAGWLAGWPTGRPAGSLAPTSFFTCRLDLDGKCAGSGATMPLPPLYHANLQPPISSRPSISPKEAGESLLATQR